MDPKCDLNVTPEVQQGLEELSRSREREEADRARAVLWSAQGWKSPRIAEVLGVTAAQVRIWRTRFRTGGVAGLRSKPHPGRPPKKAEAALPIVAQVLAEPTPEAVVWTYGRLSEEVRRRIGVSISSTWLGPAMRKKGGTVGVGPGTP